MQGGAEPDRSEAQAAPEPETKGVASKPRGGKSRPQTAVSAHAAGRLDMLKHNKGLDWGFGWAPVSTRG